MKDPVFSERVDSEFLENLFQDSGIRDLGILVESEGMDSFHEQNHP